jgi:3-dehydroquinate synthase
MHTVRVNLGERSYDVLVGRRVLGPLADFLEQRGYSKRGLVVTDQEVDRLYSGRFFAALRRAGFSFGKVVLPRGEEAKSLVWVEKIYTHAIEMGLDRHSPFIALGGGVPGDVMGFAAATYMRGAPFIQVPTTLLAQVDASVGGKVAVNHKLGKNLIGAFYQPDGVFADIGTLTTLDERDYASGLVEVIKCALLTGEGKLESLAAEKENIMARDEATLSKIVEYAVSYKARVVEADEKEKGQRMHLNLGHTLGHAIEAGGRYSLYTHGEAVGIGLLGALSLSEKFLGLTSGVRETVTDILRAFGLPLRAHWLNKEEALGALWHDKKAENGRLRWVLLTAPGQPVVRDDLPLEDVREVFNSLAV